MSKATIAQSLFWKDGKTVLPLLIAVCAGIIGIHIVMMLVSALTGSRQSLDGYTMVWVLMPNLVALGAPALLVGGEEESGTLNWLRTLPVAWQKVVDSKFLVALAAVVATWLFASVILTVAALNLGIATRDIYSHDLLRPIGVVKLAFFSFTLLSLGFATAYLFRSPIAALIALVPVIGIAYLGADATMSWILFGQFEIFVLPAELSSTRVVTAVIVAIAILVAVWLVQRLLGRRRLRAPERTSRNVNAIDSPSAYAPPRSPGLQRPNQVVALLWQQTRQIGLPAVLLTTIAVVGIGVRYSLGDGVPISDVFSLVIMLSALWIGGLAFYGDSVRRRCLFFADRGIEPTRIWWTRLLIPAICCVFLAILSSGLTTGGTGVPVSGPLIIAGFAFGQLVSMWVSRPVLTFFAAPAYTVVIAVAFALFFSRYVGYEWTMSFTAPVLLFATWRFTNRWLINERDSRFHGRVVAYTVVAILAPVMAVIGIRCATTPALRAQWRAQAMADTDAYAKSAMKRSPFGDLGRVNEVFWNGNEIIQLADLREVSEVDALKQSLKDELESDVIGEHIGFSDVVDVVNKQDLPAGMNLESFGYLKLDAVAVLLKWDREIRQDVIDGESGLYLLEHFAERAEALVVNVLTNGAPTTGLDAQLEEAWTNLVSKIPSAKLRRESRKQGLLHEWRSIQQPPFHRNIGGDVFYYPKSFLGQTLFGDLPLLSVEQRRGERFIDEATRLTLQQLETGLPLAGSAEMAERNALWLEAFGPHFVSLYYRHEAFVGGNWTQTHEDAVRKLRERYPSESTEE